MLLIKTPIYDDIEWKMIGDSLVVGDIEKIGLTSYLDVFELTERVTIRSLVLELASAKRTSRIVFLPSINAHDMEVLLAGSTVLEILILLIHFSEADGAVSVILEIDFLGVFLVAAGCHSASEALSELLVEDLVGSS